MTTPRPTSAPSSGHASGPLSGIRILDLTQVVMGPFATQILADQGADVIVIEPPGGDTNRIMGEGPHDELSGTSLNLMRNKRSASVDLKTAAGRDAAYRIVDTCDVLVTTMRPEPITRLGFDYPTIAQRRPDIVYCHAQGWPAGHPRADDPAYDDIIQAATGVADVMARVHGQPTLVPTILADKVCGLAMAQAITAALFHRERTGEGQRVEVPMTTAMTAFMLVEHGAGAVSEPRSDSAGYRRILSPERRPSATVDGWVHVLPYQPRDYRALFARAGRPDLEHDPRLADRRATLRNADSLYRDVREVASRYTTADLIDMCRDIGVPITPVATLDDLLADLPVGEHPIAGNYRMLPYLATFSRTPSQVRRPAPLIGENTSEVMAEIEPTAGSAPERERTDP